MDLKKIMEIKKIRVGIKKAESAKEELEFKVLERKADIERMEEHILLQDEIIEAKKNELKEMEANNG